MCLIVFSHRQHPRYPLVFAANRDEFFARPAAPAAFWEDAPHVLAGRDLQAGGTWCGVTRAGRWAAITNYRDPQRHRPDAPSRGRLVAGFLRGDDSPKAYLDRLSAEGERYNGFNLLVGAPGEVGYYANFEGDARMLEPGLYGLGNHLLDTPWPKVRRAKAALAAHLDGEAVSADALLGLLADRAAAPDDELPETGIGRTWERALSSVFISADGYGTRSSTVLLADARGGATFVEQTHTPPERAGIVRFAFATDAGP